MSIRWTEEDAKKHGFVQDKNGEWRPPGVQRHHSSKVPKLEPAPQRKEERQVRAGKKNERRSDEGNRIRIVITARCRRHTDPDNIAPKWFIDRLREFGIIPDDSSEFVAEVVKRVVKVESWEPETTTIEVWRLE